MLNFSFKNPLNKKNHLNEYLTPTPPPYYTPDSISNIDVNIRGYIISSHKVKNYKHECMKKNPSDEWCTCFDGCWCLKNNDMCEDISGKNCVIYYNDGTYYLLIPIDEKINTKKFISKFAINTLGSIRTKSAFITISIQNTPNNQLILTKLEKLGFISPDTKY